MLLSRYGNNPEHIMCEAHCIVAVDKRLLKEMQLQRLQLFPEGLSGNFSFVRLQGFFQDSSVQVQVDSVHQESACDQICGQQSASLCAQIAGSASEAKKHH